MSTAATRPRRQVVEALLKVMRDVGVIAKGEYNADRGFRYRSIDNIVDAASPVFQKHGVLCVPDVLKIEREYFVIRDQRTGREQVDVTVSYTFVHRSGDEMEAVVIGSAIDEGGNGVSKAMSMAWRTVLNQVLMLVTGERDADSSLLPADKAKTLPEAIDDRRRKTAVVVEAEDVEPTDDALQIALIEQIRGLADETGISRAELQARFARKNDGRSIVAAPVHLLQPVYKELLDRKADMADIETRAAVTP